MKSFFDVTDDYLKIKRKKPKRRYEPKNNFIDERINYSNREQTTCTNVKGLSCNTFFCVVASFHLASEFWFWILVYNFVDFCCHKLNHIKSVHFFIKLTIVQLLELRLQRHLHQQGPWGNYLLPPPTQILLKIPLTLTLSN